MGTQKKLCASGAPSTYIAISTMCLLLLTGCAAPGVPAPPERDAGPTSTAAPADADADGAIDLDAPAPTPSQEPDAPTQAPELVIETAAIEDPVTFDTGVRVQIDSVEAIAVTAETPGEVSGPAVIVRLSATNESDASVDVGSAIVNLVAADGEYGIGTTAGADSPLAGAVSPGASAKGAYVFMLDPAKDREITVTVNYAAGAPVAEFTGKTQ